MLAHFLRHYVSRGGLPPSHVHVTLHVGADADAARARRMAARLDAEGVHFDLWRGTFTSETKVRAARRSARARALSLSRALSLRASPLPPSRARDSLSPLRTFSSPPLFLLRASRRRGIATRSSRST